MKKIFTLIFASLFVVAAMAADHRPTVTVMSSKKYEVVIDGRSYLTDGKSYFNSNGGMITIPYLRPGYHTVKVYSINNRRGFFGMFKRMTDASSFVLRNNDIDIRIDIFGNIRIKEDRGWDRNHRDRRWDRNDHDNDCGTDDHDRNRDGRF